MAQGPFFIHYFYTEMVEWPTLDIDTAGVDGRRLFFNPEYLEQHSVAECVFILTHEIYHAIQSHPQRMASYRRDGKIRGLPYDNHYFNVCADLIINADLVKQKVGQINPEWLFHKDINGDELVEDVYVKYWKPPPPPRPGGGGGNQPGPTGRGSGSSGGAPPSSPPPTAGQAPGVAPRSLKPDAQAQASGGRFDELVEPYSDPVTGRVDLPSPGEFKEAIARAAAAAKAMGQLPASIERLVQEILEPQVNWRKHIRMLLTGRMGHRRTTWARPNRRRLVLNPIIYLPSKSGYGAHTVACVIDNSGSISDEELQAFFSEVGGILQDIRPKRIIVIWCDAVVQRTEEVTTLDEVRHVMVEPTPGGGGTNFIPPFTWLKENNIIPETLVYLTDMYGRFPEEPNYPVVWCATSDVVGPFGETVKIEV